MIAVKVAAASLPLGSGEETRLRIRAFNLLARASLVLCIATAIIVVVTIGGWESGPIAHRITRRCRYQIHGWAGHLDIRVFHDSQAPSVAPPFAPNPNGEFEPFQYTPALLVWCNALPPGTHLRYAGFGYDRDINLEINAAR